jgi:hypothetical protein
MMGSRKKVGILDFFTSRIHMSGLSNGENMMEYRRNGVDDKKVLASGMCVRSNILVARRQLLPLF